MIFGNPLMLHAGGITPASNWTQVGALSGALSHGFVAFSAATSTFGVGESHTAFSGDSLQWRHGDSDQWSLGNWPYGNTYSYAYQFTAAYSDTVTGEGFLANRRIDDDHVLIQHVDPTGAAYSYAENPDLNEIKGMTLVTLDGAYSAPRWVAVGTPENSSHDGVWVESLSPSESPTTGITNPALSGAASFGPTFGEQSRSIAIVVVGENGEIARSSNGANWTVIRDSGVSGIVYSNVRAFASEIGDVFIAAGQKNGNEGWISYSTDDGQTWADVVVPGATSIDDVTYGEGVFVACGLWGLFTSENLTDWEQPVSGEQFLSVAFGAGQFVAVGPSNLIMTSGDFNP